MYFLLIGLALIVLRSSFQFAIPLTSDAIGDLIAGTLKDLGRFKWTNIMSTIQKHIWLSQMLKKEKVGFDDGYALQWNVAVASNTNARMVGLGDVDRVNINDGMIQATIPWRYMVGAWGFERREVLQNRSPAKIFDLVKFRRAQAMMAVAELMEAQGWGIPAAGDTVSLNGIQYWIVPNTTAGFNGGNPVPLGGPSTTYAAGAGSISSVTYPNWANYTDQYNDFSKTDLVRKMRRACEFTDFETPDIVEDPSYNTGNKYGIYTTQIGKERLEEIAEQQNENLGNDVAKMMDRVVFHRIPITWAPYLEKINGVGQSGGQFSNSTYASTGGAPFNPYYGINWGEFKPVFMQGDYMHETGPERAPEQHNLNRAFIDFSLNVQNHNRRSNWVLTQ